MGGREWAVGGVAGLLDAVKKGHPRHVQLLLEAGVPVNGADDTGCTALVTAVAHCQEPKLRDRLLRLLLHAGADPNLGDARGTTPLMHAAIANVATAAIVLLQHGDVDPGIQDGDGNSALMYAAAFGHREIVLLILAAFRQLHHVAFQGQRNGQGLTAWQLAERNGHQDIAGLLKVENTGFFRPAGPTTFVPAHPLDLDRPPTPTETRALRSTLRRAKTNSNNRGSGASVPPVQPGPTDPLLPPSQTTADPADNVSEFAKTRSESEGLKPLISRTRSESEGRKPFLSRTRSDSESRKALFSRTRGENEALRPLISRTRSESEGRDTGNSQQKGNALEGCSTHNKVFGNGEEHRGILKKDSEETRSNNLSAIKSVLGKVIEKSTNGIALNKISSRVSRRRDSDQVVTDVLEDLSRCTSVLDWSKDKGILGNDQTIRRPKEFAVGGGGQTSKDKTEPLRVGAPDAAERQLLDELMHDLAVSCSPGSGNEADTESLMECEQLLIDATEEPTDPKMASTSSSRKLTTSGPPVGMTGISTTSAEAMPRIDLSSSTRSLNRSIQHIVQEDSEARPGQRPPTPARPSLPTLMPGRLLEASLTASITSSKSDGRVPASRRITFSTFPRSASEPRSLTVSPRPDQQEEEDEEEHTTDLLDSSTRSEGWDHLRGSRGRGPAFTNPTEGHVVPLPPINQPKYSDVGARGRDGLRGRGGVAGGEENVLSVAKKTLEQLETVLAPSEPTAAMPRPIHRTRTSHQIHLET